MAIKSANVIARVEPEIKKQAEEIMNDLGLNASTVINALYRQIVINKAIPFKISKEPINVDDLSDDELGKLIAERIQNYEKNGGGIPAEVVFKELRKELEEDAAKKFQNNFLQRSKRRSSKD